VKKNNQTSRENALEVARMGSDLLRDSRDVLELSPKKT
jgi:hypothetical protein